MILQKNMIIENYDSIDEGSELEHYKHMTCNMAFICEMMGGKIDGNN